MLNNKKILQLVYGLCVITVAIIVIVDYTMHDYDNYLTFTRPINLLLQEKPLYEVNFSICPTIYLYSPSFALVVGVLHNLPDIVGLFIWNMFNLFVLLKAIHLFFNNDKDRMVSILILFPSLILSVHNHQSNGILAGCILFTIYYLRKDKALLAALCTAICLFIKIYGFAVVIFCLFFKCRVKYIASLAVIILLLAALPLLFVSPHYLLATYKGWFEIVDSLQFKMQPSVMSFIQSWLPVESSRWLISLIGLVIFTLPLAKKSIYSDDNFKNLLLASLFITVIIFNKLVTTPTYIIAATGAAVWWASSTKKSFFEYAALWLLIIITLMHLPFLPDTVRLKWLFPHCLMVLPYILIWLNIQIQFWQIENVFKKVSYSSS